MAEWNFLRYKKKEVINTLGDGINTGAPPFQIEDGEHTYGRNMDSAEYPAITVRPGRSTYAASASSSALTLGQRANETLLAIKGNTWQYWGSSTNAWMPLTTGLSVSTAYPKIIDFATGTARYTLLFSPTTTVLPRKWDGTSTALTITDSNCPFTNIVAVHKGRIYAARGNDIVYCALNVTTDWTTAGDAGTIDITRAKGDITAMITYDDTVIVFTEHSMHELYGTGPAYYELIDVEGDVGCVSDRSLIRCNRRLYWLWYNGIYEYNGGSPIRISDPVKDYIEAIDFNYKKEIVAGAIGDFLYLSIPRSGIVLKFDTVKRKWFVETGTFKDFVTIGNTLYGIDNTGQCWNMRSTSVGVDGATPIPWSLITKPFMEKSIGGRKTLSEMYAVVDRSTSSTSFSISYSTNVENNSSAVFTNLTTAIPASSNITNTKVIIPLSALQNVNWYRLRFEGTGAATIHYLQKNLRVRDR